jgi:hypothetical protein
VKVSLEYSNLTIKIDLPEIEANLKDQSLDELVKLIHNDQDQLIDRFCGPKYSRDNPFKRGGSYLKTVMTSLGPVRIRVQRIFCRSNRATTSPILEQLDINHRKYSRDLRMKLADFASKMSYADASLQFEEATGIYVPKRTIHSFVQEIAPQLHEVTCRVNNAAKVNVMHGDTTEVRSLGERERNQVHVLISSIGTLLHLGVNEDYPKQEAETLVSDNEPCLIDAAKVKWRQLCILHAIKYLLFALWGERMNKENRDLVESAIKTILFTLVNSVKKHLADKDMEKLKQRIDETLTELYTLAAELEKQGYPKAASFIVRNARFMVTFAELALEGVEIPYTNNRMERLMGEISKRCKGHWQHWSTAGLRNILAIVLTRYTNEKLYNDFKDAYIHNVANR